MLISYNWLQIYFKKKLPPPEKVAEILTFTVFEVEGVAKTRQGRVRPTESDLQIQFREKKENDFILDVKVLPDRACYALSHRGIARELAAALTWELNSQVSRVKISQAKLTPLSVKIKDSVDCRRYIGRRVENVTIQLLQNEISEKLAVVGQRPINNIVNAGNFVMFDMGQPLHAFDADKVNGAIQIRRAQKDEKIITLDEKEIILTPDILIIADNEGPLAIAGIKGGQRAGVTEKTKNLILESANFNPTFIRKTAQKLNLQTDASKRFENNLSPVIAEQAIMELSALIMESSPDAKFGEIIDQYPIPESPKKIELSPVFATQKLGMKISEKEIRKILNRLNIVDGLIPPERRDLQIPEDLVEEIGRLYGYEKIPAEKLPITEKTTTINKTFYWENKIRQILIELGFSEIITSSFKPTGEMEIEKPLASDKAFLRIQLADQLIASLKLNTLNLPLLGLKKVKIFEIGKVFTKSGEETHLALNDFVEVEIILEKTLGEKIIGQTHNNILEINLDLLIEKLSTPKTWDLTKGTNLERQKKLTFKSFSLYPFIVRDIAIFVPTDITIEKLWQVIEEGIGQEKNLLTNYYLFDQYQKNDRKSLAFRLVFQAPARTLTDDEVNKIMDRISIAISQNDWQVR